ncbi:hypothetical protein E4U53_006969 [Claviceps sorghi]|nr:hypothetical protein E4U53_006969 [Claviceps sorghi]
MTQWLHAHGMAVPMPGQYTHAEHSIGTTACLPVPDSARALDDNGDGDGDGDVVDGLPMHAAVKTKCRVKRVCQTNNAQRPSLGE